MHLLNGALPQRFLIWLSDLTELKYLAEISTHLFPKVLRPSHSAKSSSLVKGPWLIFGCSRIWFLARSGNQGWASSGHRVKGCFDDFVAKSMIKESSSLIYCNFFFALFSIVILWSQRVIPSTRTSARTPLDGIALRQIFVSSSCCVQRMLSSLLEGDCKGFFSFSSSCGGSSTVVKILEA